MAKDPAMLWYWNDWNSGTVTLSRHLKGCYIDLLHAQFNCGHLSLEEIKTILGTDFEHWPTLKKKFETDKEGLFFNERLELEQEKRKAFTASRRENLNHKVKHMASHMDNHMENENRNVNTIDIEDWGVWGELIVNGEDQVWEGMRGRKVQREEMDKFLSVATRNGWKMNTQQAFRISLNGFSDDMKGDKPIKKPSFNLKDI